MNFVDEILGSDGFIVLADVDWPSNVQSILNECWSDGDHPLKRLRTTLGMVNLFGIACICGKSGSRFESRKLQLGARLNQLSFAGKGITCPALEYGISSKYVSSI